ncbi:unnamed protein product [Mytilus edulis]|uniref:Reverse transcriptase domain-containing protein n=1 Tax=Mytilus edulis TaxID=6550 RepID=A0A8S3S724_MYTED|nr:unnamed protein product [Mytilus edulis]
MGYSTKQKEKSKDNCHDSNTVANYFNNFFTTIADNLVSKLPPVPKVFDIKTDIFKNKYNTVCCYDLSFKLKPVTEEYIFKQLQQFNPSKSTGLDGIPSRFLRDGSSILAKPITYIVILSITSGIVPEEMKTARVCPIFKKNSRLDVGNYRPVSILIVVSKIVERFVYSQLEKYLVENDLLYNLQSGFRSAYSTDTCLIHLLDHIKNETAKGLYTGMIMLDLQKAFDTVDNLILCNKLQNMGVKRTTFVNGLNHI